MFVCVCVCVCVRERERERGSMHTIYTHYTVHMYMLMLKNIYMELKIHIKYISLSQNNVPQGDIVFAGTFSAILALMTFCKY